MLCFTRLQLNNYGQHEELTVELEPGVNGVIGPMGCGKSTVIQAMRFALTGETEGAKCDARSLRCIQTMASYGENELVDMILWADP